ncbi:MAG TPA: 23S rRNA (pseudouridine(1915)-N(3))-methyltransferase RlmH [Thermoplasmata archaeon]|nr:23S rRNA (pseudouridine(1915)-N(3))-methyltransferase RlmH [Thermoplasmata archaeon]
MLKIVCIGKLKEKFYREAEKEYKKRIERFIKIDIEEVKKVVYEKCDYKILLDENGNEMGSKEFSDFISNLIMQNKKICFIIGGWKGFDKNEKEEADFILSLSKMTFPYQLCRIILLEQIYRAITLIKGIPYHK